MKARRLIYLGYYIYQLDWQRLDKFMSYLRIEKGWSRIRQWFYIVCDCLKFNISILEYYQFRFFELPTDEKRKWAGTGTMYEFQRRANPPASRGLLSDKRQFYQSYKEFFRHELRSLDELRQAPDVAKRMLANNHRLVFKQAMSNCGSGVSVRSVRGMTFQQLVDTMESEGFDLVEEFVNQHPVLNALSPSAVNTIRIFTQISEGRGYEVLGCRLRISVDSPVDNLAAGNMAAPIDTDSGVVSGPGIFSDITVPPAKIHPITGCSIVGLQIPFWSETLELVREASLLHPENRSIGWDIVITEQGPGLIEGNHDWCKLVWQLPVRRGLKHMLVYG